MAGHTRYRLTGYDGGLPPHPRPEVEGDFEFTGLRCTLSFRGTRAGVSASLRAVSFSAEATGPSSCLVTIQSTADPGASATFQLPNTPARSFRRDLDGRLDELARARARRLEIEAGSWWLDEAWFDRFGRAATASIVGVRYLGGWTTDEGSGHRCTKVLDLSAAGVTLRGFRRHFTIPWPKVAGLDVAEAQVPGRRTRFALRWAEGVDEQDAVSSRAVSGRQGTARFETSELDPEVLRTRLAPLNERISQAAKSRADAG